jgi:uncharacterized protein
MLKRIVSTFVAILFIFATAVTSYAADAPLIIDEAGILGSREIRDLNQTASAVSEMYRCDVAVIIISDLEGEDIFELALKLYDDYGIGHGAGKSGLLLLLSMEERDYILISKGRANTAFTDHGKDVLLDKHVLPLLAKDEYYAAFESLLDKASEYLQMAQDGAPFDTDTDPDYGKLSWMTKLVVIILLPMLIAGIVCVIWAKQMKTAISPKAAENYISPNSFALTGQEDRFLFLTETRRRIEQKTSRVAGSAASGRKGKF